MKSNKKNEEVCGFTEKRNSPILILSKRNMNLRKRPILQKSEKGRNTMGNTETPKQKKGLTNALKYFL